MVKYLGILFQALFPFIQKWAKSYQKKKVVRDEAKSILDLCKTIDEAKKRGEDVTHLQNLLRSKLVDFNGLFK